MTDNVTKIGLIGAGRIARVHWHALRWLPLVSVEAVTSRTRQRAENFAREYLVPKCTSSVDEMLEDPSIQAVHVCNANTGHFDAVMKAMRHNKMVLCEKPLGANLREAEEIEKAARDAKAIVSVCYSFRFHPTVLMLKKMTEEISPLRSVDISYFQSSWLKKSVTGWKPNPDDYGNSYVLADIGSHAIDLAQNILGKTLQLKSARITGHDKAKPCSDIKADLSLETTDRETRVKIAVSKTEAGVDNRFGITLVGEGGSLTATDLLEERVQLKKNGSPSQWIERTPDLFPDDLLKFPVGHTEGWLSGFANLFKFFYQAGLQLPNLSESVQIARLIDLALQEGEWVELQ